MPSRPRLVRSIPFWGLVVVSLALTAGGAYVLTNTLGTMTTTLNDGTATSVDVYVGQPVAVVGAIVLGTGILGILLALAIAAASTLRPVPPVEAVEPIDWDAEAEAEALEDESDADEPEEEDSPATDETAQASPADETDPAETAEASPAAEAEADESVPTR